MANFWQSFREISADFIEKKIPTGTPGFCDHPNFVAAERLDPYFLANYARFVQRRTYDEAYLSKARREIPVIAKLFREELVKTGRLGACVDASQALSRILEREGYWNYCVNGSLVVRFPATSGFKPARFWAIDFGDFAAGHAWICVPPFEVLDITLKQQPYDGAEGDLIPEMLLLEDPPIFRPLAGDLMSPRVEAALHAQGHSGPRLLDAASPNLTRFLSVFPGHVHEEGGTTFRYACVGIKMSDMPLEQVTNMRYSGLLAIDVYRTIIQPALVTLRAGAPGQP